MVPPGAQPVARSSCQSGVTTITGLPHLLHVSELEVHTGGAGMDIPLTPGEQPLKLTGNRVWDATLQLVEYLRDLGPHHVADCVIDLGAGTGVAGLACHSLGAAEVVLTDLPSQLPLLQANVEANRVSSGKVWAETLDWRCSAEAERLVAGQLKGAVLWVLAAEVLYPREQQLSLVDAFFDTLLAILTAWAKNTATVFLAYEERSASVTEAWRSRALQHGFLVQEVVSKDRVPLVFELRLPHKARLAAAQGLADRAQSVAIFEAHWELLQPFVEHGLRDVARAHVAGVLDVPSMLVSWHAQRVLQQYHDLSRVFGAIADLRDARLVTAAEGQIHNLQSQLLQLELPTDHRAAHAELGRTKLAMRQLQALLHDLPQGPLPGPALVATIRFKGLEVASLLPTLEEEPVFGADSQDHRTCSATAILDDADLEASLPETVAAVYAAILDEVASLSGTKEDGSKSWQLQAAEDLLALLDDCTPEAAREWLETWRAGPETGTPTPSVRRAALAAPLERQLKSG
ncbi:unnamed protein product [Polarella glacialis]|uniref:Uncharacterized protein n=1 Tax=Polarella glacialis TaxID=89957 RepID=A0A813GG65_POLGL|nr:unnamed protein product [Polarella glacialis]